MTNFYAKLKSSIKFKFIVAFIVSIVMGNIISFSLVEPYIHMKIESILLDKYEIVMSELVNSNNYQEALDKLLNSCVRRGYTIFLYKDIDELNLTNYQKLELEERDTPIYVASYKSPSKIVGKIDNMYMSIGLQYYSDLEDIVSKLNKAVIFTNTIICSCIISLVTRMMTRPIEKLEEAANEISTGNFNINIDIESNDEIGMLVEKFNSMAKELKNIEYMQNDFINNISHELKTPLAAIDGFATILKNNKLSQEERNEYLDIIIDETNRLSELSSNILTLAKLDNIDSFDDNKKFFLDEQLRRTVILLEKQWTSKNISFNLNLCKVHYYGKEEYLMQLWINLINNAIKFSNENGEIDIECYKDSQYAFVKIKDYGCGMSEDTRNRLFNKFFQADNSRKSEGYGLGLPICKRIIDLSKGKIEIDSEEGRYTEILISLPKN